MSSRSIGCCLLSLASALAVILPGCEKGAAPGDAGKGASTQTPVPAQPKPLLVPKHEIADWCGEHGVPESRCTRCNPSLVDAFKQKGDWCGEHDIPKSQCIACDPGLKAKLEAMAPKAPATK